MSLEEMRIAFTTDSDGDVVVYGSRPVMAKLLGVFYDRGDMATGADFTLTTDNYPVVETILSITDAGTSDLIWYPRHIVQSETGGDLTGTVGGDRDPPLMVGRPKLTVAQGGDITSGAWILILEE